MSHKIFKSIQQTESQIQMNVQKKTAKEKNSNKNGNCYAFHRFTYWHTETMSFCEGGNRMNVEQSDDSADDFVKKFVLLNDKQSLKLYWLHSFPSFVAKQNSKQRKKKSTRRSFAYYAINKTKENVERRNTWCCAEK